MPLSQDQLDAMNGMGLKPDQSAAVLGHSTGILSNSLAGKSDPFNPFPTQGTQQGMGNFVSSMEQPFVSLAATPLQAGIAGYNKLTGSNVQDPFKQGIPGSGGSSIPVSPLGLEQKGGDVLKAGSEIGAAAAAPATIPGAIGAGALIGGAQSAGNAMQQGQNAQSVAKQGGIGALIGGATAGVFKGLGSLIQGVGDKIQTSVIRPTKADIEDGFSLETMKKYNLGGSLSSTFEKTQNKMNDLSTQLQQKLQGADTSVNLQDVYKQTVSDLTDSSRLKGFGANNKIANMLQSLQGEIGTVGDTLSVPDAQVVKQAAGNFGAWKYGQPDGESKAQEMVYNTFYSKLKGAIEDASPEGVKGINQELSSLIPVQNAVLRRLPVAERSNLISLNDMIGLVGSTMHPAALGPTLISLISRNGAAGDALSKFGPQISKMAIPGAFASGALGAQQPNTEQSAPQFQPGSYPTDTPDQQSPQAPSAPVSDASQPSLAQQQNDAVKRGVAIGEKFSPAEGSIAKEIPGIAESVAKSIHPEDIQVLTKFIDGVRLNKQLPMSVEKGAQALAEHWGLNVQKSASSLANDFEQVLQGAKKVKGTIPLARDEAGKFK